MTVVAGLFQKYEVAKRDGSPTDPQAVYFVLRLDTDPHARRAAAAYATAVERENPELAADLLELLRDRPQRGVGQRTLVARYLTAVDVRRLAQAARLLVQHADHCGRDIIHMTSPFKRQVEAIISQVVCMRCGGNGRIFDGEATLSCPNCEGMGIA